MGVWSKWDDSLAVKSLEAYEGSLVKAGRPQVGASLAVRVEVLANYLVSFILF